MDEITYNWGKKRWEWIDEGGLINSLTNQTNCDMIPLSTIDKEVYLTQREK